MARPVRLLFCFLLMLPIGGCKSLFGNPGVPADPIFGNRKPVAKKALAGPPIARPFTEPAPPLNSNVGER